MDNPSSCVPQFGGSAEFLSTLTLWVVLQAGLPMAKILTPNSWGLGEGTALGLRLLSLIGDLGNPCSCPLTPVVSKASAGAMEVMDVFSTDDLAGFLQVTTGESGVSVKENK